MTISELIERLEALKAEHGDLPVYTNDDGMYYEADPGKSEAIVRSGFGAGYTREVIPAVIL